MGIVNATPDSFSDDGGPATLTSTRPAACLPRRRRPDRRRRRVARRGDRPAVAAEEEIERVLPLVRALAAGGRARLDRHATSRQWRRRRSMRAPRWSTTSAACAIPSLADGVRPHRRGAGDDAHARARRRRRCSTRRTTTTSSTTCPASCASGWPWPARRPGRGADRARPRAGLRQDARPDGRRAAAPRALRALGRPLLLAVSRKDFVGALTGRAPRERGAGTLAAIG